MIWALADLEWLITRKGRKALYIIAFVILCVTLVLLIVTLILLNLREGSSNYITCNSIGRIFCLIIAILAILAFIFLLIDEILLIVDYAKIEKDLGVIDILVNNAGIIKRIPMCDMQVSEFKEVIDIDLVAPFIVAKHCIPQMIKKGHGKIINICSMMSELGRETVSAYASAKGGLKMLTRNICSEFGGNNIQCNGLGPGYIATPQTAPLREKQKDGSQHPFDKFIISKTPARKWGDPDELIGSAIFLASDASNFVNGQILYVDGGILAYIGKNPQ